MLTYTLLSSFIYRFLDRFEVSYTKRVLVEAIQLLGELWIYLVAGIVLSTLIKMYVSKEKLASFFTRKRQNPGIVIASLIGIISPLGSYITIPMSAALFGIGVPLPALMALMVSSPLINPNLFVFTAGAMGMEMALLRTFSAFVLGCFAGYSTLWLEKKRLLLPEQIIKSNTYFSLEALPPGTPKKPMKDFLTELYKMTRYVGKYFFLALLVASLLKIAVNPKIIIRLFDPDHFLSVLFSTAAGVPFYVCGGAAIPVVQQLAELGMSKGAALAFFISGPITKLSNLLVLQATFKGRVLAQYLIIGIVGALFFGLLYNRIGS